MGSDCQCILGFFVGWWQMYNSVNIAKMRHCTFKKKLATQLLTPPASPLLNKEYLSSLGERSWWVEHMWCRIPAISLIVNIRRYRSSSSGDIVRWVAREIVLLFLSISFFQSWLLHLVSPSAQWLKINLCLIFTGKSFKWTGLFTPSLKLIKEILMGCSEASVLGFSKSWGRGT